MRDLWRRLWPYLVPYRKRILAGVVALVACSILSLIVPQVIERAIDSLGDPSSDGLSPWEYGAVILAVSVGAAIGRFYKRWYLIGVSRYAEYDMRRDFHDRLQRLPASFFARFRVGDILSRGAQDMNAVRMSLGPGFMYPIETLFTTIGCFAFMLSISPMLTLVAVAVMPVVSVLMKVLGERIFERSQAVQAKMADISAVVQENASASRVIRAFVQEDAQRGVFARENEDYALLSMRLVAVSAALFPLLLALIGLGLAGSLVFGGRLAATGAITIGELVAFLLYYGYLTWPMIALGWVVNIHQRGAASMKRLAEVYDAEPMPDPAGAMTTNGSAVARPRPLPPRIEGAIEFHDVEFAYPAPASAAGSNRTNGTGASKGVNGANGTGPDASSGSANGRPVLSGFNLTVEPGQTVALVGRTGSGKSTVARLVPRLYDVSGGQVRVDGRDVRDLPLSHLRESIGFVPQDSFLFSMTVRDNLAFGNQDAGEEDIRRAASEAGLDGDIENFPERYGTMVGERGVTLSGGQRQRAAIARALLLDTPILILDDVLSAVDSETESRILEGIRRAARDRTTVIVAHRLSTIRDADAIYVLDAETDTGAARIAERGTHEELLAAGGLYAAMYRRQMLEEEIARL